MFDFSTRTLSAFALLSALCVPRCSHIVNRPFTELPRLQRVLIDEQLGVFALSDKNVLIHLDYETRQWRALSKIPVPQNAEIPAFGLIRESGRPYIFTIWMVTTDREEIFREIVVDRQSLPATYIVSGEQHHTRDLENDLTWARVLLELIDTDSLLILDKSDSIRTELRMEDLPEHLTGRRHNPHIFYSGPFEIVSFERTLLLISNSRPKCSLTLSSEEYIIGAKVFESRLFVLSEGGRLETFMVADILEELECE